MAVDMFLKLAGVHAESEEGTHLREIDVPSKSGTVQAGDDVKPERTRTWRRHWQASLWAFAFAGWGVIPYLYHSHPYFP